jgi:hypothetical protein
MSERPDFEEGDDDATKKAKMKAWLEGVRDDLRPQVNALSEACSEQARQLAADMGEAPTDTNRIYWGTMGNLLVFDGANSTPDRPSFMRCTISPAACRGARLGFYTLNDEPARCKRASATHSGNPLAFRRLRSGEIASALSLSPKGPLRCSLCKVINRAPVHHGNHREPPRRMGPFRHRLSLTGSFFNTLRNRGWLPSAVIGG